MTTSDNKNVLTFEASYLVSNIECGSCEDSCENAIKSLKNSYVKSYNMTKTDSDENVLTIESNIPPSTLVTTLQEIGKDAVIRGTLSSLKQERDLGACVSILETPYSPEEEKNDLKLQENESAKNIINESTVLGVRSISTIRGIVRAIELASNSNNSQVWLDVALTKLPDLNGNYMLNVHKFGNLQNFNTLGPILKSIPLTLTKGSDFKPLNESSKIVDNEDFSLKLPDLVGRGVSICDSGNKDCFAIGLWARSSGMWGNTKKVCACSGKTIWEERKDALESGLV
ncbi:hypothetical protein HANVADRAFT_51240 [Hanseniaspora valbyensis NRRL Y-1626]|uniref:Uncharacterized protein n=1 Tax=Hanseniaspora valbyensis NRRL Y-1626 TaxID=766949 RepID=A0A1B7TJ80_9ASCO|nr:hypothetical protein HANVADRAFT_51240 [Hanseniaspora valbyensis NRRL Y-1626]